MVEPEPDLCTGSDQRVPAPAPQHWMPVVTFLLDTVLTLSMLRMGRGFLTTTRLYLLRTTGEWPEKIVIVLRMDINVITVQNRNSF